MYFRSLLMDAPGLQDELSSQFRYRTRSTCALFVGCLPRRLCVGDDWRFAIQVVASAGEVQEFTALGVRIVEVVGDPSSVLHATPEAVGPQVLQWIQAAFAKVAPQTKDHVEQALAAVRALNFVNEREVTRRSFAPGSRTRYAVIHLAHEVEKARITLRVVDKKTGTLVDHPIAEEKPDELHFEGYFEPPEWASASSIRVVNKVGIRQSEIPV